MWVYRVHSSRPRQLSFSIYGCLHKQVLPNGSYFVWLWGIMPPVKAGGTRYNIAHLAVLQMLPASTIDRHGAQPALVVRNRPLHTKGTAAADYNLSWKSLSPTSTL
jgi:hypothetical protein